MSLMGLFYGYLASVLGLGAYHSMDDNRYDDFGGNATDREYIQYLHDMVNRGEMTEEEALSKLKSNWKGNGDPTEYYNSYTKNANGTYSVGGYGFGMPDLNGLINSLTAYYTRNTLTGAENEQNAFNAEQAQMSRDFTEYMARNKYSMETQSMQDAGVNPAMVYGGGSLVPTAANGSAASGSPLSGGNIADLMSTLVRMPLELKQLSAEIDLTAANADKSRADAKLADQKYETEVQITRITAINADYQDVMNAQTLENLKATYENTIADSDLKSANKDYVLTQKDAQDILNKYLDERQREEINQIKANTKKLNADEAYVKAQKVYQDWYNNFVLANDFLPSSNDYLMLGAYICSIFDIDKKDVKRVLDEMADDFVPGHKRQKQVDGKGGPTSLKGGDVPGVKGNER